jgi:hypothetical protein
VSLIGHIHSKKNSHAHSRSLSSPTSHRPPVSSCALLPCLSVSPALPIHLIPSSFCRPRQPGTPLPPHHRREEPSSTRPSSLNRVAEEPEEALKLSMLTGDPALGSSGGGGAGFAYAGSATPTIACWRAPQRLPLLP